MKDFQHYNAASVDEAISLLQEFNGKARLFAGGTDLLGTLKADILADYPEALINIKSIGGLDFIKEDDAGLTIGALAKLIDIAESSVIKKTYPILAQAAESVASPEIRNMGTVAGNLCQETRCWYYRYPHNMGGRIECFRKGGKSCPAVKGDNRYHAIFEGKKCFAVCPSDMAMAMAALNASITITGPEGKKTMPIMEFYKTMGCALKPDEILTEIIVPRPPDHTAQIFSKFRVRESVDFAIASVATAITMENKFCKDVRIILGAVAPTPYRATAAEDTLKGKSITPSVAETAAAAAVTGAKPLRKNAYKVEIVKTLVKRAIEKTGEFLA
jgi:xanthine dehydrogenase YagS FAD-binding subunit